MLLCQQRFRESPENAAVTLQLLTAAALGAAAFLAGAFLVTAFFAPVFATILGDVPRRWEKGRAWETCLRVEKESRG